jgi:hypothetical protein
VLITALVPTSFAYNASVYAQEGQQQLQSNEHRQEEHMSQVPPFSQTSNFTFGDIASIQNDESGKPAWIAQGHWKGNLLTFNQTNNATVTQGQSAAIFSADFRMVMLNGSGSHSHAITNFNLTHTASYPNGTKLFNGTTTISMKESPATNVPTVIKISGEVISIFPDPSKLNNHFGNTPIYGLVEEAGEQEGMKVSNATGATSATTANNNNNMMP